MPLTTLNYHLHKSFIHNWLVAGPEAIPLTVLSDYPKDGPELAILKHFYAPKSSVTEPPVDLGPLNKDLDDSEQLTWRYYRCADEDHFIDLSATYPECAYLRAWAYTELEIPRAQKTTFTLTTHGPADFWLNGSHAHRQEHFQRPTPVSASFQVSLSAGRNALLFRFETAAIRETPFVMALRVGEIADETANVKIPTEIDDDYLELREAYEEAIQKGYLDKYVYGFPGGDLYDKNEPITVRFAPDLKIKKPVPLTFRLQSLRADIFQEGNKDTDSDTVYELAKNYPIRDGHHHLALIPEANMYYLKKIRLQRLDNFYVVRSAFSDGLSNAFRQRQREALDDAAKRLSESIFTELARMARGHWDQLDAKVIQHSLERIDRREDGCIYELIGLAGMLLRFKRQPDFPKALTGSIEARLLAFRYWEDEPGEDVMDFKTEGRQILFHAGEILAGQLFPQKSFTNAGQTGRWHREKGARLALEWMNARGAYGWQDWDAPVGFEEELAALSYLVDFASTPAVSELASIVMDKLFFTLAINSVRGCFGSTHGRSDTAGLLSARLEATSGISRLMWGTGNFNERLLGTVSLALMKRYDIPGPIKAIAAGQPQGVWNRERHGPMEVNKVTYKTADTLLCSAQDYKAFTPGSQEHIWQATLGPDAVVFVNHPGCMSEDDAHSPNFWKGNAILPRVVQWGDVLIGQYRLPEDDWMGFTHAYFPTTAFDGYKLDGNWAFAFKNKGYLALYSSQGFELVTHGQAAYRELRSYAKENTWICHLGHKGLDGSFEEFQKKIKQIDLGIAGLTVTLRSLRGDQFVFGPEPRLVINGQEQAIAGYRHYESPYCIADYPAATIDIGINDQGIRLNFSR